MSLKLEMMSRSGIRWHLICPFSAQWRRVPFLKAPVCLSCATLIIHTAGPPPLFLECLITCCSRKSLLCCSWSCPLIVIFISLMPCSGPNQTGQRPKKKPSSLFFPGSTSCHKPLGSLGSCTAFCAQKGPPKVECSAEAVLTFLKSLSLNWCFVSEV